MHLNIIIKAKLYFVWVGSRNNCLRFKLCERNIRLFVSVWVSLLLLGLLLSRSVITAQLFLALFVWMLWWICGLLIRYFNKPWCLLKIYNNKECKRVAVPVHLSIFKVVMIEKELVWICDLPPGLREWLG